MNKIVLALETSQKIASLAIINGTTLIDTLRISSEETVSKVLISKIEFLLHKNSLKLSDLELIAVSLGPGSLNGIRVGIAAGQALAFSQGIDCYGVSLFEAIGNFYQNSTSTLLVGYKFRQSFYWQFFSSLFPSQLIKSGIKEEFTEQCQMATKCVLLASDNSESEEDLGNNSRVNANELALMIGLKGIDLHKSNKVSCFTPLYLEETNFKKIEI